MRNFKFIIAVLILIAAVPSVSFARPQKGFHTGPYLALQAGIAQVDFDTNQVSGTRFGYNYEPAFGFIFGWNIWDSFSAELQGRYITNFKGEEREHIANANVYAKWSFILDALTDFKSLRILPFVKGGLSTRIAALPGDPNSSDTSVTMFGIGPTFGGGVMFEIYKYIYFGFDVQEDLLFMNDVYRTVGSVPGVLVYKGGFRPSLGAMGTIGVHY